MIGTKRGDRNNTKNKTGRHFSIHFCPSISSRALLESDQASLVCPPGKNNMYMKMSLDRWWNNIDRERRSTRTKTRVSATLFTTFTAWTYLESNAGLSVRTRRMPAQSRGAASEKK